MGSEVKASLARWDSGQTEWRVTIGESEKYLNWVEEMKAGGEYEYDKGIPG